MTEKKYPRMEIQMDATSPIVENATQTEIENLLIGFLDALVTEQKKAYGFTHQFAQVILNTETVSETPLLEAK
jgi:hypothetical protein